MQQLQKVNETTTAISSEKWQQNWDSIPVVAASTPSEVLQLGTPQLSQLGKSSTGQMLGVTIFRAQIMSIVKFLGADWDKEQIKEAGELAYQECYWFSLAELKQFVLKIKTSAYKSHKNFSPAIFMEFLQEYAGEMLVSRAEFYGSRKIAWQEPAEPVEGVDARIDEIMQQMRHLSASALNEQREQEQAERQQTVQEYQAKMKKLLVNQNEDVKALMDQGLSADEAINQLLNLEK